MDQLDIGIVGCGFAGAAVGLLLERQGHQVTIYEAVAEPRAIGAGIVLQPTGMRVLDELGLLQSVLARGAPLEGLRCRTRPGRTLVELKYAELVPGLFGLGLHRGALFEALLAEVRASKVRLVPGCAIARAVPNSVERAELFTVSGERAGEHQLVIVADGARSALRQTTDLARRARPYPWGALWFVARDPDRIFERELQQVVDGTERFLGLLPTGLGPKERQGERADEPLVSLFWSVRLDQADELKRAGLDAFRRQVVGCDPRAAFIVEQIESMDQLLLSGYLDVVMREFSRGPIVFLGDAAHAMSPQLGQGCNLALLDALVLAECVAEFTTPKAAFLAYAARRRPQLATYARLTRWLTPFFQSDYRLLGWLRDALMGPACALGPVRREMLRTMIGVKTALVMGELPLDSVVRALPAQPKALLGVD